MAKSNIIFRRVEKKYLLDEADWARLRARIAPYVERDRFGQYTICNLFYDTENYELIRRSIEKPVYKEKLRLRSYGAPAADSRVFLELKKKFDGTVFKRRVTLPLTEALDYLERGVYPSADSQILREIDYVCHRYHPLRPMLFLAYERRAYCAVADRELRITVDCNIRSRHTALDLRAGDQGELLLPPSRCVLEIKTVRPLPLWLTEALAELKLYPSSFSKYGRAYAQMQAAGEVSETCFQAS